MAASSLGPGGGACLGAADGEGEGPPVPDEGGGGGGGSGGGGDGDSGMLMPLMTGSYSADVVNRGKRNANSCLCGLVQGLRNGIFNFGIPS